MAAGENCEAADLGKIMKMSPEQAGRREYRANLRVNNSCSVIKSWMAEAGLREHWEKNMMQRRKKQSGQGDQDGNARQSVHGLIGSRQCRTR